MCFWQIPKKTFALKQQQNTLNGNKNFIGKCKDRGWRCQIIFIYGSTLRSLWPWPCTRDSISAPEIIIGSEFRFYFGSHTSLILRKHKGLANWYEIWWQCHINFCIVPSLFLFCFFSLLQTKWIFRTVHRQQILQCFGGIIWWWQAGHSNFYL